MLGCEVSFDLSLFYIKPQLIGKKAVYLQVVLYLCSTSNHNIYDVFRLIISIYNTFCINEVAEMDLLLCKNTKKTPIAMGLASFFFQQRPIYE